MPVFIDGVRRHLRMDFDSVACILYRNIWCSKPPLCFWMDLSADEIYAWPTNAAGIHQHAKFGGNRSAEFAFRWHHK